MENKIFLYLLFCPVLGMTQQNVVANGGNATGSGGSLSYSVGQIDYKTISGSNHTMTLGVQQPFEIYTVSNEEISLLSLTMYPNPTENGCILNFDAKSFDPTQFKYEITDADGKRLSEGAVQMNKQTIDFQLFKSGQFFLTIWDLKSNQKIKVFKIVKL